MHTHMHNMLYPRTLYTLQDLVNIAEGKVSNMAHEKKELERENGELTSQV